MCIVYLIIMRSVKRFEVKGAMGKEWSLGDASCIEWYRLLGLFGCKGGVERKGQGEYRRTIGMDA